MNKIGETLRQKLDSALKEKQASEKLLKLAKQVVEAAIETSEEEALSLIEQNGLT